MSFLENIPLPTIDRPFGIELWPIFDAGYKAVTGSSANDFKFIPDKTRFSTMKETATIITLYYAIIFGGRELMRNRPAMKLNALFQIHNVLLTAISGTLLVLFIEQLSPILARGGLFYGICSSESWTQKMEVLYYLNYLTKYFELLDTVFLFLKKKPLTFLHCYHHGATALLCYTQLIGSTSVSWVPITLNLIVHVVMYWYYFLAARGIRVWWKEWITRLQITQFVIDLGFVYFASYTYFTSTYWPHILNAGKCAGEEFAAFSGVIILSSYLLLFISFYFATYKNRGKRAANKKVANGEIAVDPKFTADVVDSIKVNGSSNGKANGANGYTNGATTRSRKA